MQWIIAKSDKGRRLPFSSRQTRGIRTGWRLHSCAQRDASFESSDEGLTRTKERGDQQERIGIVWQATKETGGAAREKVGLSKAKRVCSDKRDGDKTIGGKEPKDAMERREDSRKDEESDRQTDRRGAREEARGQIAVAAGEEVPPLYPRPVVQGETSQEYQNYALRNAPGMPSRQFSCLPFPPSAIQPIRNANIAGISVAFYWCDVHLWLVPGSS
ncbi:predicted protein [Histoplasma capsulatum G186AR]|uniref:Uncharacterized protein n=1 Tax=Ajellomyces capsulatus (strain G186AR / H82 / ATCC MYA-2454 / RMSCC 2432) TaxID=447093 RepID=C0NMC9_AJECG|nr:uncharacterized protein HCBG_04659 [Histoplasma capsulatum G186AR]EEH07780.1 predicted protein [Histoplasma capsulatum G186AR]